MKDDLPTPSARAGVSGILYDMETDLLKEIASLLGRGAIGTAEWKLTKLRQLGIVSEMAVNMISKYRGIVELGMDAAIEKAALEAALKTDAAAILARKAGADVPEFLSSVEDPAIRAIIQTWQRTAAGSVNLAMATMAQNAGQLYVDTINRTVLSVLAGATDSHKALVTSCREWAEQGIPSIVDKAGRQWTTEAYVNAVIRSNVRRVTTETAFARMDEYDTDLIEISSHAGARPLCAPYQGLIFSRSGQDPKYPALSSTSYGEAAGLFGINCGHIAYPYWEGVSVKRNEPAESEAENSRQYEDSQKQRGYERAIRAAKREVTIMQSLGDLEGTKQAKALVRDRQAAMREFIDTTDRTRRYGREQNYA